MPHQVSSRDASGQVVTLDYIPGSESPGADPTSDVTAASQTDSPAAPPASGQAPEVSGTSAPQPPDGPASGEGAAPAESDEDLSPMADDQASVPFVNRRIKQLNAKRRALEREHAAYRQATDQRQAYLEGRIQQLTQVLQGAAPPMPDTPAESQGPPQSEQFASHDDYIRALTRHELQEQQAQARAQTQQTQRQQQMQDLQRQVQEREAAFLAAHPDYHTVIQTGLAGKLAPHVQQALMLLEEGPALAYRLATQPEAVQQLNQLAPPLVFAQLGRLSAGTPTGTTTPTASGHGASPPVAASPEPLPPPPTPLSGAGQGVPPDNPADWTQAEFRKKWNSGWRPTPSDFGRR